jgi:hypothetical protein
VVHESVFDVVDGARGKAFGSKEPTSSKQGQTPGTVLPVRIDPTTS